MNVTDTAGTPNSVFNQSWQGLATEKGVERASATITKAVTIQRLQALIDRGVITPDTPLDTDTGHTGLAGQIPGLNFDTAEPSPFAQPAQAPPPQTGRTQDNRTHPGIKDIAWFDFSFRDIRLPKNIRTVCSLIYVWSWIWGILIGIGGSLAELQSDYPSFLFIIIYWLTAFAGIFFVRIICEWQIVLMDWITTTKNYVEDSKSEREK